MICGVLLERLYVALMVNAFVCSYLVLPLKITQI